MKTSKLLLTMLFLFMIIGIAGCEDDENETYPDAIIVKELPRLSTGNNTRSLVIRSQKELEAVFDKNELERVEELQQIDFSKYTLLSGFVGSSTEVYVAEHSFSKTGTTTYTYLLEIIRGYTARPDAFRYGIIVLKLPKSAEVVFKIEELRLED